MTANAGDTLAVDTRHTAALVWPDLVVAGLLALASSFAGNLFMVSLAVYATLTFARDAACLLVRHDGYQRRAHRYEFGTGKLEQAANLAIAAVKIVAGLWLGRSLYVGLGGTNLAPTQSEVSMYALVTLLYTLRCAKLAGIGQISAMAAVTPIGRSPRTRLLIAIMLQLAITLAALSENTEIIVMALSAGVVILTFVLILSGMRQARDAILDLVDHPLDTTTETRIKTVLRSLDFADKEVIDVRSRRAGMVLFVELTIAAEPHQSLYETRKRFVELRRAIETRLPGSDVVIRLS